MSFYDLMMLHIMIKLLLLYEAYQGLVCLPQIECATAITFRVLNALYTHQLLSIARQSRSIHRSHSPMNRHNLPITHCQLPINQTSTVVTTPQLRSIDH